MSTSKLTIVCHSANAPEAQHVAAFAIANGVSTELYMHDALPTEMTDLTGHLALENTKVLLLVSDNYLKSEICMRNGLTLVNELHRRNLLLPVVTMGRQTREEGNQTFLVPTSFERVSQVIQYMNHWQDAYLELRKNRRLVSPENEVAYGENLQTIRQISADIGELLRMLRAMTYVSYEELTQDNFIVLSKYLDIHMPIRVTEPVEAAIMNRVAAATPAMATVGAAISSNGHTNKYQTVAVAELETSSIDELLAELTNSNDQDIKDVATEIVAEAVAEPAEAIIEAVAEPVEVIAEAVAEPAEAIIEAVIEPEVEATVSLAALAAEKVDEDIVPDILTEEADIKRQPSNFMYLEDLLAGASPTNSIADITTITPIPSVTEPVTEDAEVAIVEPIVEVATAEVPTIVFEAATIPEIVALAPEVVAETKPTTTNTAPIEVSSFITSAMLRAQAQAHIDLARIFRNKDEVSRAHEHYQCAIAIDPALGTPALTDEFALVPIEIPTPEPELPQVIYPDDNGKVVFITGATSGIGKAIAARFAAEGYRLILTGRRNERLEEIKEHLHEAYQNKIATLNFDVRNKEALTEALATLGEDWQSIDLLINNAGLAKGLDPIHEGNLEHWETMIDTNLKGLLYITRAVAPHMVARQQGHIINIASTAGKLAYPNGNVYCATKAAVDMLTRGMRQDLYKHNIRVSQISPGAVEETEFAITRFDGDTERAKIYDDYTPLRAADVADTIYFMATRPAHVNIDDVVMQSTQQATPTLLHRNGRG